MPEIAEMKRKSMEEDEKGKEPYRRAVRFGYLSLQHRISEEQDDIASGHSKKFVKLIIDVDKLHEQVVKPREQVVDAEVLLGLTNTVFNAVKSQGIGGITPSDFVSSLVKQFGVGCRGMHNYSNPVVSWKDIGRAAPPSIKRITGCRSMIGAVKYLSIKVRKQYVRRHRQVKLCALPKQVTVVEKQDSSTEKNIAEMFGILRKEKTVRLEHLILNRHSFAQTVENVFALSFLVKDGRVAVDLDDSGSHFVSIRNAPYHSKIVSEEVKYHQFFFRLDFSDWKLMMDYVPEGEELMLHRDLNPKTCKDEEPLGSDLNVKTCKEEEDLKSDVPRQCFVDPRCEWGSTSKRSPTVKKAKLNRWF